MASNNHGSRDGVAGTIDLSEPASDITGHLHHLPCSIKYSGQCSVSDFFKAKQHGVVVDDVMVEEAAFRGRKLEGATILIPDGYRGYIVEKQNTGENNQTHWKAHSQFRNFTYWNHDTVPSSDDEFRRLFHWFSVADALHKPLNADDLASCLNQSE